MTDPQFPKDLSNRKPVLDFIKASIGGDVVSEGAAWAQIFDVLDEYRLWAGVGDALRASGLEHPFDPVRIPSVIREKLDRYKSKMVRKGIDLSCQQVSDILEQHSEELCISKYGEAREGWEQTAEESFQNCLDGKNPGTCSEVSRRYVAASLYLNSQCELKSLGWTRHIESFPKNITLPRQEEEVLLAGGVYEVLALNGLYRVYYEEIIKQMLVSGMAGDAENSINTYWNGFGATYRLIDIDILMRSNYCNAMQVAGSTKSEQCWLAVDRYLEEVPVRTKDEHYYAGKYSVQLGLYAAGSDAVTLNDIKETATKWAIENPWDYKVYKETGRLLVRYGEAEDVLRGFVTMLRGDSFELQLLGGLMQNPEAALQSLDDVVESTIKWLQTQPQQTTEQISRIQRKLGALYITKNDTVSSLAAFKKALEADPSDDFSMKQCLAVLADVKTSAERRGLAAEFLNKYPDSLNVNLWLYDEYMADKMVADAEALVFQWLVAGSQQLKSKAYTLKAQETDDVVKKIVLYSAAMSADPENVSVYFDLAYLLEQAGERERVDEVFNAGLGKDPFSPRGYSTLSDIYLNRGFLKEAELFYVLSSRLAFDYEKATELYADIQSSKGEYEKAEFLYTQALKSDPESAAALGGMIISKIEKDDDGYKDYLRTFTTLRYGRPYFYYVLGRVAEKEGAFFEAAQFYGEVLKQTPGNVDAEFRFYDVVDNLKEDGKCSGVYDVTSSDVDFFLKRHSI